MRLLLGRCAYPSMDWRLNEFCNEGAHALTTTCVELMTLPSKDPASVAISLLEIIEKNSHLPPPDELPDWINAVGIILANLPEAFWLGLSDRIVDAVSSLSASQWTMREASLFDILNPRVSPSSPLGLLLACAHSAYHHAGFAQVMKNLAGHTWSHLFFLRSPA